MRVLRGLFLQFGKFICQFLFGVAELHRVQLGIQACFRHQFFVRAQLDDFAFVQHGDAVGHFHSAEAMGDDDRGAMLHQVVQGFLHQFFRFVVQRTGGFIQKQDARVF